MPKVPLKAMADLTFSSIAMSGATDHPSVACAVFCNPDFTEAVNLDVKLAGYHNAVLTMLGS